MSKEINRGSAWRRWDLHVHTANIVVGADAEEVIVANQRGKNASNKDKRFEYKSGSIEDNVDLSEAEKTSEKGMLNWIVPLSRVFRKLFCLRT